MEKQIRDINAVPALPVPVVPLRTVDGSYRIKGHTRNSYDGNTTHLTNMTIHLTNGQLSGTGSYGTGSNYNSAYSTM